VTGNAGTDDHLVALPGTGWSVWRQAVLRTTGFPAEGLARLAAPDCAATADAYLDGSAGEEEFAKAFDETARHCSREVYSIATDALFREAVTWQSRTVLSALDGIRTAGPEPAHRKKQRERERIIARYWQRYCAKTETIGFFGPVCWVVIDPDAPAVTARPGTGLLRDRRVFLEHWSLTAYADVIAANHGVRRWFAPALHPHLTLDGDHIIKPAKPPLSLLPAEASLLAQCDGRRKAVEIARRAVADPASGVRAEEDVYLLLERLARRGVVHWDLDLPMQLECEQTLRDRLGVIGDESVRAAALAGLDRMGRARDAAAAAAGEPDVLDAALSLLEAEFTAVTGLQASRRPGQMYAGRSLCWEETIRDLDVVIGGPVLEAIAAPMAVILQAARWLSAAVADAYLSALRGLYEELAAELGSPDVPLGQLWFLAQGLFYGSADRPADSVAADLGRRWARLFGLDTLTGDPSDVSTSSAALVPMLSRIFPAQRPGWADARLHSPDLQLCAASTDAMNRGEFIVVLSEMHVAWATNSCGVFVCGHPDPAALRAAQLADLGPGRVRPLLPADWARNTSRLASALDDGSDILLGFATAPGADPDRLLPITAVSVRDEGGSLVARTGDGRRWPLAEIFARPLSEVAVEAFKLTGTGAHTPRITLDRMVVARQTWRTTVGECGLATAVGDRERFLAARRWRRALDLPEHIFVKVGTETKPLFADLTSPLYVASLTTILRAARASGGDGVAVTVTEMLPTADQAWVPDSAGHRYLSELRLQIRDPEPASTRLEGSS
jgi:Lantibiotic dehydratase, N terminus